MKILVTGAKGLLGQELVPVLATGNQVIGVDLDDFDLTDESAVLAAIADAAPDAIVHCAAWSDVDGAEADPVGAFKANGLGTKHLCRAANSVQAHLLAVSTDYVFDGSGTQAYVESDPASPLGIYGRSKWMSECFVREMARDWSIVRTQALYGATGRSFVGAIAERVGKGLPLSVVNDQVVCPTRAKDLAAAIRRILLEGGAGTWHASSKGDCSWFDFAGAILELLGCPEHPLSPMDSAELARPAPRPAYSVLRNLHLQMTIGDTLPHWKEALAAHMAAEGMGK
jgi:dTDP-4-dehydrorhamnose reductase